MKIILEPTNLRWMPGSPGDRADLCAHGKVLFQVNDAVLVAEDAGECTVSAAALFLLRTLSQNHTEDSPVGDQLFPCCGFTMYDIGEADVLIQGCALGHDFDIRHEENKVHIIVDDDRQYTVDTLAWHKAVCGFADKVEAFYESSSPKQPCDEDAEGYNLFRQEWQRRRQAARAVA